MGTTATQPSLWDRSRQAVVASIFDTAMRLFAEQGYEATTIAQIAKEAGISQRSLFRYFGTKEDIVCGEQEELGELLRATVEAQPAAATPWEALRAGFEVLMEAHGDPGQLLEITTLIFHTPPLRARYTQKRLRWQELVQPAVTARMAAGEGPVPQVRAAAVTATVFACVDAATEAWVRSGGSADLASLYDEALAAVRG
ncbi:MULTISPECIES: TetR/AcrR family transcriptional regulator [Streptomyces]|uniref:TetR/AcrR family transcriptional regulator n=1 Tax=Streptomyces flavotricini TaxID=66888 RepID=A0ABS8E1Z3_9ACTN|nr:MULTISPECIES: TetR/AcrR family transcriptional regulator [Streptomyces]MCC0095157.1 TetR/AcrR family transcriptional regulator [Streptomyces flavotricini]WSI27187.1 TetR/AcrR family transcriptional regulator [Streptomyces sp. NBC_01343]